MDVEAEFSKFVTNTDLNSVQYKFVQQIIDYICQDGFISPAALYETPFKDLHDGGPDGVFGDKTDEVFDIIDGINGSALVGVV